MRTIWGVIMGLCQHSSFSGVRLPHRLRRGGRCCGCSIKFKLAPGTPAFYANVRWFRWPGPWPGAEAVTRPVEQCPVPSGPQQGMRPDVIALKSDKQHFETLKM